MLVKQAPQWRCALHRTSSAELFTIGHTGDKPCSVCGALGAELVSSEFFMADSTTNERGFETDYDARKAQPIVTGVLDYFPLALLAVAEVSADGNAQHNPGEPLHWAREKSQDEVNTALRHLLERGHRDGRVRHLAKAAWRVLAALQKEIEAERCTDPACEVHVLNQDKGGACTVMSRASTWYGRRAGKGVDRATLKPGEIGYVYTAPEPLPLGAFVELGTSTFKVMPRRACTEGNIESFATAGKGYWFVNHKRVDGYAQSVRLVALSAATADVTNKT